MKILSKQTGFRLIPDMTGTVEITVGHKLVITYFFYPIAKAFDQSFWEAQLAMHLFLAVLGSCLVRGSNFCFELETILTAISSLCLL